MRRHCGNLSSCCGLLSTVSAPFINNFSKRARNGFCCERLCDDPSSSSLRKLRAIESRDARARASCCRDVRGLQFVGVAGTPPTAPRNKCPRIRRGCRVGVGARATSSRESRSQSGATAPSAWRHERNARRLTPAERVLDEITPYAERSNTPPPSGDDRPSPARGSFPAFALR